MRYRISIMGSSEASESITLSRHDRWFQKEVSVPHYLEEGQNLFDQPPFAWAFENPDIFPPGTFKEDKEALGKVLALNLLARYQGSTYKEYFNLNKNAGDILKLLRESMHTPPKDIKVFAEDTCRALDRYFRTHLEGRAIEYLGEKLKGNGAAFTRWGIPPGDGFSYTTYVGWLHEKQQSAELKKKVDMTSKFMGLSEIVPSHYATVDEIKKALPQGKSIENKFYRIIGSEALR